MTHPTERKMMVFKDVPIGSYFIWKRDCRLGPLLKCNANEAMDDGDREYRIPPNEEVLL